MAKRAKPNTRPLDSASELMILATSHYIRDAEVSDAELLRRLKSGEAPDGEHYALTGEASRTVNTRERRRDMFARARDTARELRSGGLTESTLVDLVLGVHEAAASDGYAADAQRCLDLITAWSGEPAQLSQAAEDLRASPDQLEAAIEAERGLRVFDANSLAQLVASLKDGIGEDWDPARGRVAVRDTVRSEAEVDPRVTEILADELLFVEFCEEVEPASLEPVPDPGATLPAATRARMLIGGFAKRGGLAHGELEQALDAQERLEAEAAALRWTLVRGEVPTREEWRRASSQRAGWPTIAGMERLYGDGGLDGVLESAGISDSAVQRLLDDAARRLDEAEGKLAGARDAEQSIEKERRELERLRDAKAGLEGKVERLRQQRNQERDAHSTEAKAAEAAELALHEDLRSLGEQLQNLETDLADAQADAQLARDERDSARRSGAGPGGRLPARGLEGEGRAAYTIWLELGDVDLDAVITAAAEWMDRSRENVEAIVSPPEGRALIPLEGVGESAEVTRYESDGAVLWEAAWRRPFQEQLTLFVVAEVTVARADGRTFAGITLRLLRPASRLDAVSAVLRSPRLVRTWLQRFPVIDADLRLTATPTAIDTADLVGISALMAHHDRRRPVVLTNVSGVLLARELAGLAHVVVVSPEARRTVAEHLGVRLPDDQSRAVCVWPGALPPVTARDVTPALAPRNLSGVQAETALARRLGEQISLAAVVGLSTPSVVGDLRRAAVRSRLRPETQDAGGDVERLGAANDDLLDQLVSALDRNERLERDLEASVADAENLRRQLENDARRHRGALFAMSTSAGEDAEEIDVGDVDPDDAWSGGLADKVATLPDPADMADAVRIAAEMCPHLIFAERALTSAADSPYRDPRRILMDLVKVDRVAELYLRPEGIGRPLIDAIRELGLNWAEDADASRNRRFARHYRFMHDGREWTLGPHSRTSYGPGAGNTARTYFAFHEGDDETERCVIVGHVGRKLDDESTTGKDAG